MPIKIDKVSYAYAKILQEGACQVLQEISLDLPDGQIVGLAGISGAGKTTLLQLIKGLLRPTEGQIDVDGNSVTHNSRVGMVFQYPEDQLFAETVFEDVAFGLNCRGAGKEEVQNLVYQAILDVGLDPQEVGSKAPWQLSGGEQRRVALAGVLVTNPQWLLLDEPTAGLDPRGREELLARLKALNCKRGLGMVVVSHWMEDLAVLVDRLVVLDRGRVILDGATREIFARYQEQLAAVGLEAPSVVKLASALKKSGWPLNESTLTTEELYLQLKEFLRGNNYA